MSTTPNPPINVSPINPETGRFNTVWSNWFRWLFQNVGGTGGITGALDDAFPDAGILVRKSTDTYGSVILQNTDDNIVITYPDGVNGDPRFDLADDIVITNTLTAASITSEGSIFLGVNGSLVLRDGTGDTATILPGTQTGNINLTLPIATGTLALTSDIPTADTVKIVTLTADNTATQLNFDNYLTSTYSVYRIDLTNLSASSACNLRLRFGTGTTPTYVTTGYLNTGNDTTGATTAANNSGATTYIELNDPASTIYSGDANGGWSGSIWIYSTQTARYKTCNIHTNYRDSNALNPFHNYIGTGRLETTTVVTSIRLVTSTGNLLGGTATLYGIK